MWESGSPRQKSKIFDTPLTSAGGKRVHPFRRGRWVRLGGIYGRYAEKFFNHLFFYGKCATIIKKKEVCRIWEAV